MKKRWWLRICIQRKAPYSTAVSTDMPIACTGVNSPAPEVWLGSTSAVPVSSTIIDR
ncbi:hypothetical protein D3C72_1351870 [compost metagenome]